MNRYNFILSSCGTSILTNQAINKQERDVVFQYANKKSEDEIPLPERSTLKQLISTTMEKLETANDQTAAAMSAELNGIIQIYQGSIPENSDFHFLLSTDTWLGEETAKLVQKWLKSKNSKFIIQVHRHTDLQTADISAFQYSLSELVRKLGEDIPGYFFPMGCAHLAGIL